MDMESGLCVWLILEVIFVLCVFEFESVSVRESCYYNVIWKLIFLLVFVVDFQRDIYSV